MRVWEVKNADLGGDREQFFMTPDRPIARLPYLTRSPLDIFSRVGGAAGRAHSASVRVPSSSPLYSIWKAPPKSYRGKGRLSSWLVLKYTVKL